MQCISYSAHYCLGYSQGWKRVYLPKGVSNVWVQIRVGEEVLRLLESLFKFGENPYMVCIYYRRLLALLARLNKRQMEDVKDSLPHGWFCMDIHPSPCRWRDSMKEGGKVSTGTGSKSEAEGGKQGAFCPGKPMNFALFARCEQREQWGLDAFSVHAWQLLPTWGSDPTSSNSFAFLSHCTHVPWVGRANAFMMFYCLDIWYKENCFPGLLENSQNTIWLTSSVRRSSVAIIFSTRSWQDVRNTSTQTLHLTATWFLELLAAAVSSSWARSLQGAHRSHPKARKWLGSLTGYYTPLRPVRVCIKATWLSPRLPMHLSGPPLMNIL